jgi:hypothetical protein
MSTGYSLFFVFVSVDLNEGPDKSLIHVSFKGTDGFHVRSDRKNDNHVAQC